MTDTAYTQPNPTTFDWYESALKGARLHCNADEPQTGYYEDRRKNMTTGAVTRRVVAFYWHKGDLFYRINGELFNDRDRGNQLWAFASKRPIEYQLYKDVLAGKPWPDEVAPEVKAIATSAEREIGPGDNNPPELLPHIEAAESIGNAIRAAEIQFKDGITTPEQKALAEGSKNRLADLRLAADKAGKALYQPIYTEYKRLFGLWNPMVARAEIAEKLLGKKVLAYMEKERQRLLTEQQDADAKQREIDDANARAADRAIAAGAPEPAPVVVEAPKPAAPVEAPKPTYGKREVKAKLQTFVVMPDTETGWQAVAFHLSGNADVRALLTKLAQAEIDAGRAVPGCTTREGLI